MWGVWVNQAYQRSSVRDTHKGDGFPTKSSTIVEAKRSVSEGIVSAAFDVNEVRDQPVRSCSYFQTQLPSDG
jgi:hypothetical protein